MSWWWKATPSPSGVQPTELNENETEVINPQAGPAAPIAEPVKQTLSREEQSNLELMELLKEFQAQEGNAQEHRVQSRESGLAETPTDISPDSLYPKELSCRSALDYAMFCQSFGGQFVNIYRYGNFRSCSNHWQDFWLCMRTRNWDKKDRAKAIQDHYRKKAIQYKTGPSSEDVWEVRQEPAKDAFQGNLEELEAKIAQWQKANPGRPNPWNPQQGTSFNNPAPAR